MDLNLQLVQKIHEDAGSKSHIAITRDWSDTIPELKYKDRKFFDRMYNIDEFVHVAKELQDIEVEDTYFSINSFRRKKKQTSRLWHLNGFLLDFDYYKLNKYEDLTPIEMYELHIKDKLDLLPTAVIDSGRGLYVIYTFKHACKSMLNTYNSIYKSFYGKLKEYGLDQNAMNVTQIMRIPGTLNTKSLRPVEVVEFNDTNYQMKDFFPMFKYSRTEVVKYKNNQKKKRTIKTVWSEEELERRYAFRNELTSAILMDLKKLIELRNKKNVKDGYRELIIFMARKRMQWKGSSLEDELRVAHELNDTFKLPLTIQEVEQNCAPRGLHKCCTIQRMIYRLNITEEEQRQLHVLRRKSLKDSERLKKKRIIKLLNITEKQQKILKRRTMVAKLKNEGKRNVLIAQILTIDKSTVTRDLAYIKTHASKFLKKLKEAMKELKLNLEDINIVRSIRYDDLNAYKEWMLSSEILLE